MFSKFYLYGWKREEQCGWLDILMTGKDEGGTMRLEGGTEGKYWQTPPCSWQIWLDASCDEYQTRWYQFSHNFRIYILYFRSLDLHLPFSIDYIPVFIRFLRQKDLLWINIVWVVTWYYMQPATWKINQFGWDMGVNYPPH